MAVEYDGEPNGLKIHKDGRIFVADYRRGILQLDPASGALSPVVEHDQGQPFKGAKHNDMIEYLPPDRANQPFGVGVLPWRSRCSRSVANAHHA